MSEHKFGGIWTEKKLEALDNYLNAYMKIMKNQSFRLIYIDTFAGSGNIKLDNERSYEQGSLIEYGTELFSKTIDGSAIRALKYPFDKFKFFETNKDYCEILENKIKENYWNIDYNIVNEDCNNLLMNINTYDWVRNKYRGIIFLDPYAMELSWQCLEEIAKTKIFDVWYLFPFMAANRNLYNNGKIPQANKDKLNNLFGTDAWEKEIYTESSQISLFGDSNAEKIPDGLKNFAVNRFKTIFPIVSE